MHAQDRGAFLRSYIPPDYSFTTCNFSPRLNQSLSENSFSERSRINASLGIAINYNSMVGKNNLDGFFNSSSSYNYNKSNGNLPESDNVFQFINSGELIRDHYLKEPFFIRTGLRISSNLKHFTQKEFKQDISSFISIPIGFGIGRPLNITDAWHSMSIQNDLEKRGLNLGIEDQKAFSDFIYTTKRTRVKDGRLKRIFELEQVYNYLEQNSSEELSPLNAALISDSWSFEAFRTRRSGGRLSAVVVPYWNVQKSEGEEDINEIVFGGELVGEYFYVINEDWQFDNVLTLIVGPKRELFGFDLRATFQPALSWYYNARTFFSTGLILDYLDRDFDADNKSFGTGFDFSFNYYFSPSLAMTANVLFTRLKQGENKSWSEQAGFGFNYRIW